MNTIERIAEILYEATRREAEWSQRSIVPEAWNDRDDAFRRQFVQVIQNYLTMDKLPTPEEAHDSWVQAYTDMGWVYGPERDPVKKTHPDMVPFDQLPKDERDKDAIFLALIYAVRLLMTVPE